MQCAVRLIFPSSIHKRFACNSLGLNLKYKHKFKKKTHSCLQVPPAIPCLLLCCFVSAVRRCRLVIDWHNFAFTLMALSHGKQNAMVRPICLLYDSSFFHHKIMVSFTSWVTELAAQSNYSTCFVGLPRARPPAFTDLQVSSQVDIVVSYMTQQEICSLVDAGQNGSPA